MRAPLGAAAAGLALLCAKTALADPPRLQVDEGLCFDAPTLARRVEQWRKTPADPRIQVRVKRSDRTVSFTLARDATPLGERTMEVPQAACDEVTDAVAVAVAMALDANRAVSTDPPEEPLPPAESMFRVSPTDDAESAPVPVVATPRLTVSAEAVFADGLLSRVAPGIEVGFNRAWAPWFETQLLLLGVSGSSSSSLGPYGYSPPVRGRLLAAILDGCAGKSAGPALLRACLGVAFGAVLSYVEDPAVDIPAFGWGGPTARVDGKISVGLPFSLVLSVDGFLPVVRPPRVWCCGEPERGGESTAVAEAPVAAFGLSSGLAVDF
jgi:hypothetical protein